MHVKMLDMPDNVATKNLLSGFADDKFNNRLQTLKNRHSLRVTEEEEESSGMAGIPKTMLFKCYFTLNTVFLQ